jgi:release factor glutamine methyltransferase
MLGSPPFEPRSESRVTPAQATTIPTLADIVAEVTGAFVAAGIEAPRTEARDLVAAILDRPRFWPTLHGAQRPAPSEWSAIRDAMQRRVAGAPFAYAVRRAAFRFLTLEVDERVLIPRPETERLVELVLATPQARGGGLAVDVGTGSGAIALALASEGRFSRVIATDVSVDALAVARINARLHEDSLRADLEFRMGSALAPVRGLQADVIVSNPPYIAWSEVAALPRLVRDWEPTPALCCDDDGLRVTRQVVAGAIEALRPGGLLALEVDVRRAHTVAGLVDATGAFTAAAVIADYTGRDRFVMASRLTLD